MGAGNGYFLEVSSVCESRQTVEMCVGSRVSSEHMYPNMYTLLYLWYDNFDHLGSSNSQ